MLLFKHLKPSHDNGLADAASSSNAPIFSNSDGFSIIA